MKVLFDHQAFMMQNMGGVSRSFAELYKHFPADVDACIPVNLTYNTYLHEMGFKSVIQENCIVPLQKIITYRLLSFWNHIRNGYPYQTSNNDTFFYVQDIAKQASINALKTGNYDVFHPTFYDDYFLPYLNGKPFVLTIHDMIPERYPQYFDLKRDKQIIGKRRLAGLASAIIAVSEKTKEDIISILGIPEEKIQVIYHGYEHMRFCGVDNCDCFETPYILFVGDRRGYKNFRKFVEAVAPVLRFHKELSVVCVGKPFIEVEISQLCSLGVRDRFIFREGSSDESLFSLYRNALCFVYPSEYEGFGIPILEAYQAGCPVLLTRTSCFPEIAGDAALYFDFSMDGRRRVDDTFFEVFEKVYNWTENERSAFIDMQRQRLAYYSWDKSARQLSEVYENILKKQHHVL